jgi:NADH-quinone oxidoreductase subunit L
VAWIALIPLMPAAAFAAMLPMSRRARTSWRFLPLVAMAGSLALSLAAFARVWPGGSDAVVYHASYTLTRLGGSPLALGIQLDAVSAMMLLVVTIVAMCVFVYSLGYMHKDERQGWYFAVLSLFSAAMLFVVLAGDFLTLYMAWEVMGLCSYLLIGFWHKDEGPRLASIKAFLTTRVGDVGFAIGLAIMWASAHSFDFAVVLHGFRFGSAAATAIALCLLFGAMGKSAQVPLHVWLPDAMAGPTPASALIHAATMVAAGVYLVARALPIFAQAAPWVFTVVLVIGLLTALLGGLLALVQHDIKKILAYSTISQLGYMFIALGAGGAGAALFHLLTHAFFKSLLFLGAGVIIHATHTQDIREMGGLRKAMPWTTGVFVVGALALSGVFPFSGFWSKDDILLTLYQGGHYIALGIALFVAGLTAFYMTRLCVRVFGDNACSLAHEGHRTMVGPMVLLAGITVVIGFASTGFATFIGETPAGLNLGIALTSTVFALGGIGLGVWVYGFRGLDTDALKARFPLVYGALVNKFYFDMTYERVFVGGFRTVADWLARVDLSAIDGVVNAVASSWARVSAVTWDADTRIIDAAVNGVGAAVVRAGARARDIQGGRVQTYQRLAFAGLLVLLVLSVVFLRGA